MTSPAIHLTISPAIFPATSPAISGAISPTGAMSSGRAAGTYR